MVRFRGDNLLYSTGWVGKKNDSCSFLKHHDPHKIIEGLNKSWEKCSKFSIWSYIFDLFVVYKLPNLLKAMGSSPTLETPWVVGFFGGVGTSSPSIRGRVFGTLRKPAAVRGVGTTGGARGASFGGCLWNLQGFFFKENAPGNRYPETGLLKRSMGFFCWFLWDDVLCYFDFFMVNEVLGVYFVELVWSNRLRLICYHSGACRFGRWEPPCHAMTASRCSIIRSNSVSLC